MGTITVEWFLDLIPYLYYGEIQLIAAIMRSGRDGLSEAGNQSCTKLKARLQVLVDDTGLARRSVILASQSLEAIGALTVYPSSNPHGEHTYILYTSLSRRHIEAIKREREVQKSHISRGGGGGGGESPYPGKNPIVKPGTATTTTPGVLQNGGAKSAPLRQRLHQLGVVLAEKLVEEYDTERIQAALDYVTDIMAPQVRSQAGFLVYLVRADLEIPAPPSVVRAEKGKDPDKYIKGKYAHIVKR